MCDILKPTLLSGIYEILAKPFNERSDSDNEHLISTFSNLRFFQRCVSDITEREEFIMSLSQHLKYKHFPRGTAVCQKGDAEIDFGIVLKGSAIMYEPKIQSEIGQGIVDMSQTYKFEKYKSDLEEMEFSRKLKKWNSLRFDRKHTETLGSYQELPQTPRKYSQAYRTAVDAIDDIVEHIINPKIDPDDSLVDEFDYSFEDKLLMFHHNDTNHNYFSNTRSTYKKARKFKEGDAITEQSLLTELSIQSPIIAAEDLHILSISHFDFYSVFKVGTPNEKKMFLASIFPDLLHAFINKLAAGIEEKVCLNGDTLYEQGQEAQAIYILKRGRIQLLTLNEDERIDRVSRAVSLLEGNKKNFTALQKLKVGEIAIGGVFGEDEVINRSKRKYFAVCSKTPTLVYAIKKEIYEVLEKHFPMIISAFKKVMKNKAEWRNNRVKRGMTVINTVLNNASKTTKTKVIIKENEALPTEVEFQTIDLKDVDPDLEVVRPPFPGDFEERTSRNIKSKVAIRTCSPSPEINEPSKFNKLQRQYTIKRSGSISENKISPMNRTNDSYSLQTKFVLTRQETESPTKISHLMSPPPQLYHHSSVPNSPSSANNNSSPYFLTTRNLSPKGKKSQYPVIPDSGFESGIFTNLEKMQPVATPARASRTMASFHIKNNSAVSLECSPRDAAKAKTFAEFTKKTNLSPKSSHFYKRIILSQPTNKKKVTETLLTDITPFDLKSLSKIKNTDVSRDASSLDFLSFRKNLVALLSPTTSNTQYTLQQLPDHLTNKAKSIPQTGMDLDSSMQTPQKMFLLNRGISNPQVVIWDPTTAKPNKDQRKTNRYTYRL